MIFGDFWPFLAVAFLCFCCRGGPVVMIFCMHKAGDEGRFLLFIIPVVSSIVDDALFSMAILHLVVTCRIITKIVDIVRKSYFVK